MLIMEIFSAALYLAHPELDRANGVGLFTELSTWSHVTFVSLERFFFQKFDDHSLFMFHDAIVQTSFNVI
jgi:hypothetical protein